MGVFRGHGCDEVIAVGVSIGSREVCARETDICKSLEFCQDLDGIGSRGGRYVA